MRNKIYLIFTIIIFLIVCPVSAKRSKQIMVHLQSRPIIVEGGYILIQLTYYLYDHGPYDNRAEITLDPNSIRAGRGLVIKHNGNLVNRKSVSTTEELQSFELAAEGYCQTKLVIWSPSASEWTKLGILSISYTHPWLEKATENNITFTSNTLLIAVVSEERLQASEKILTEDEQLARAVYEFQNPPFGEFSKFARAEPASTIIKAIKIGMEQDEIIFLLGSPDAVYSKDVFPQYDEKWSYTLSPVKTISIAFQNGKVTYAGTHVDCKGGR